jgi:hypothetical protein
MHVLWTPAPGLTGVSRRARSVPLSCPLRPHPKQPFGLAVMAVMAVMDRQPTRKIRDNGRRRRVSAA